MPHLIIQQGGEGLWTEELAQMPHVEVVDDPVRFTVNEQEHTVTLRLDLPDNTIVTAKVPSRDFLIIYHTLRDIHKDVDFGG